MMGMEQLSRTVAIVGASADRSKFGNKAVRAFLAEGWTVYPVNPRGGRIEGLAATARLSDLEVPLDRISVYLPPAITLDRDCGRRAIRGLVQPGLGRRPGDRDRCRARSARPLRLQHYRYRTQP